MHDFRWPALITLGVMALLFAFAGAVGKARAKYNIKAPATTGDPAFERTFRAHQNSVENAVIFLPALWLFAAFVSEVWAAALGAVWIGAYVWYFAAYQEDAAKRGRPFGLSTLVFGILALGAAWGVVSDFF
jgi:glutathione S-transferase